VIILKLRSLINDYTFKNEFEIKVIDKKVYVYYYDDIREFNENKIIIKNFNNTFIITGEKLVIETLFKEYLIINGNIKNIKLGYKYE